MREGEFGKILERQFEFFGSSFFVTITLLQILVKLKLLRFCARFRSEFFGFFLLFIRLRKFVTIFCGFCSTFSFLFPKFRLDEPN